MDCCARRLFRFAVTPITPRRDELAEHAERRERFDAACRRHVFTRCAARKRRLRAAPAPRCAFARITRRHRLNNMMAHTAAAQTDDNECRAAIR